MRSSLHVESHKFSFAGSDTQLYEGLATYIIKLKGSRGYRFDDRNLGEAYHTGSKI